MPPRQPVEIDFRTLLESNPLLLTFTVIGIGYLVRHIRVASIAVGPTAGLTFSGTLIMISSQLAVTVGPGRLARSAGLARWESGA